MAELISSQNLDRELAKVPDWECHDQKITRTFEFPAFIDGIDFVRDLADLAEDNRHHPDIDIRWTKVTLTLTTHSAGGLTKKDIQLAQEIDDLFG